MKHEVILKDVRVKDPQIDTNLAADPHQTRCSATGSQKIKYVNTLNKTKHYSTCQVYLRYWRLMVQVLNPRPLDISAPVLPIHLWLPLGI